MRRSHRDSSLRDSQDQITVTRRITGKRCCYQEIYRCLPRSGCHRQKRGHPWDLSRTRVRLCVSNPFERLSAWFLRASEGCMHKGRLQRLERSVSRCQHFLRRRFWHPRCYGWLSFFPHQDPIAVILSLPPGRHPTQVSQRFGWMQADLRQ